MWILWAVGHDPAAYGETDYEPQKRTIYIINVYSTEEIALGWVSKIFPDKGNPSDFTVIGESGGWRGISTTAPPYIVDGVQGPIYVTRWYLDPIAVDGPPYWMAEHFYSP